MAARKRKYQTEKTKEKIRATMLIDRLQRFAMGEDSPRGDKIDLNANQVKAIIDLLDRSGLVPKVSEAIVTNRKEDRSYEEIREEMVTRYGEDMAKLILGEMTKEQYAYAVVKAAKGEIEKVA